MAQRRSKVYIKYFFDIYFFKFPLCPFVNVLRVCRGGLRGFLFYTTKALKGLYKAYFFDI
mgnify:CR=1 FL=1